MRRGAAAVGTLMVWVFGLGSAGAETPAARQAPTLSWRRLPGAEGCPALRQVASKVDAHLGGFGLVAPSEARAFIDASVEPAEPSGFRVRITLADDADTVLGVRELVEETSDCASVVDAAALAIALIIDPDAGNRETSGSLTAATESLAATSPSRERVAEPVPAAPSPPVAQPEPERDRPARRQRWRSRISAGGLGAVGQLPSLAWGALGGVRLSPETRQFGVDVLGLYLARERKGVRTGAGGQFAAAAAALSGFWAPLRDRKLAFSVGAGAQLGRIVASGFGFSGNNNYAQSWLVNATLDLELWRSVLDPWGFLVRGTLGVPLWRDRFEVTQAGRVTEVFRTEPVVGFLSVGLLIEP